jgi:hypothetical protein
VQAPEVNPLYHQKKKQREEGRREGSEGSEGGRRGEEKEGGRERGRKEGITAWGIDLTLVPKCLSIRPLVPGVQGDCRREWLRAKETDAKWRQKY